MTRQTVAVIGAGVSGLTAAHILQKRFDVTLFEADPRPGGHVDTRDTTAPEPVDLGFQVYNELYHSNVRRLFNELGVASRPADMSADVVCVDCHFAALIPPSGPIALPERPDNVDRETWDSFADDLKRFGPDVLKLIEAGDSVQTLGTFLEEGLYSEYFARHYIYPLIGGWHLVGPKDCDGMPIQWLIDSMRRSGMFDAAASSAWRRISGGGREYVERITSRLTDVRTSTPVRAISRSDDGVDVRDASARLHHFDKAVIATPPPQALRILTDPTSAERAPLGTFAFSRVEAVLHTDSSVLPPGTDAKSLVVVSCATPLDSLNRLTDCHSIVNKTQGFETDTRYIISYNPTETVDPGSVLARGSYEHAIFTEQTHAAQRKLHEISDRVISFAGSYFDDGFHESACHSGVLAAAALGAPWDEKT